MARFALKEEVCGATTRHDVTFDTNEVKLTYIPSPTKGSNGFFMRIQGSPDAKASLQVTCTTVDVEGGPPAGAGGPPPPPPPPTQSSDQNAKTDPLPKLPSGFDIRKYPGLLNRTLAAFRDRLGPDQQQGSSAAAVGHDSHERGSGPEHSLGAGDHTVGEDEFNVSGKSGTLSAVIASLASIIVIMGSIGLLLWYRRNQKRKNGKNWSFFSRRSMATFRSYFSRGGRSTVRSTNTIYTGPAVYNDPDGPDSKIPTTLPSTNAFEANGKFGVQESLPVQSSFQRRVRPLQKAPPSSQPPTLPKRPSRPSKEKCMRLPNEEDVTQDVTYDNAGSCVKLVEEPLYSTLNDIAEELHDICEEVKSHEEDSEKELDTVDDVIVL